MGTDSYNVQSGIKVIQVNEMSKIPKSLLLARELKQISVLVSGSISSSLIVWTYFWFQLK
jgi:hypothetical protein